VKHDPIVEAAMSKSVRRVYSAHRPVPDDRCMTPPSTPTTKGNPFNRAGKALLFGGATWAAAFVGSQVVFRTRDWLEERRTERDLPADRHPYATLDKPPIAAQATRAGEVRQTPPIPQPQPRGPSWLPMPSVPKRPSWRPPNWEDTYPPGTWAPGTGPKY
jgi:hypothetical protein